MITDFFSLDLVYFNLPDFNKNYWSTSALERNHVKPKHCMDSVERERNTKIKHMHRE